MSTPERIEQPKMIKSAIELMQGTGQSYFEGLNLPESELSHVDFHLPELTIKAPRPVVGALAFAALTGAVMTYGAVRANAIVDGKVTAIAIGCDADTTTDGVVVATYGVEHVNPASNTDSEVVTVEDDSTINSPDTPVDSVIARQTLSSVINGQTMHPNVLGVNPRLTPDSDNPQRLSGEIDVTVQLPPENRQDNLSIYARFHGLVDPDPNGPVQDTAIGQTGLSCPAENAGGGGQPGPTPQIPTPTPIRIDIKFDRSQETQKLPTNNRVKLDETQLLINQRISQAAVRRANAINKYLDSGGAIGIDDALASAKAEQDKKERQNKNVQLEISARQLKINWRIARAALLRAEGLIKRVEGEAYEPNVIDASFNLNKAPIGMPKARTMQENQALSAAAIRRGNAIIKFFKTQ